MEFLFIDESVQSSRKQRSHIVILGTIVNSENLIPLERFLYNTGKKYHLKNLKELRTTPSLAKDEKIKISQELYDGLSEFHISLISSIIGPLSMKNYSNIDNYVTATTFILERFYFYLHSNNKQGMVILDSNSKNFVHQLRREIYEFILSEEKREGKLRRHIYGPVFFCEDEFSHIIQLSDLCAAGLQRATMDIFKDLSNSNKLKGGEDLLVNYNKYLKMYWGYFLTYRNKVSGSGIKYWN